VARVLAIVDKAYRGSIEKQFFDSLYLGTELHRQLGGLDLLLRGPAVAYASTRSDVGPVQVGRLRVGSLSDPGAGLQRLMDAGAQVLVEAQDLPAFGVRVPDDLRDGIRTAEPGELARRWPTYRLVCFL
jgi:hypothetical protein